MALIRHLCEKCGHPDYWRGKADVNGNRGPCQCGCRCTLAEPEVVPTFDENGRHVERIARPGQRLGEDLEGEGRPTVAMCGCEDCKALYAQLTA